MRYAKATTGRPSWAGGDKIDVFLAFRLVRRGYPLTAEDVVYIRSLADEYPDLWTACRLRELLDEVAAE
jgi:hypothetical protein